MVRANATRTRPKRSRRARGAGAALAVLMLASACAAPASPEARTTTSAPPPVTGSNLRAVRVHGTDRVYRAYLPAGLREPAPLVLVYHGYGGDAAQIEQATGWTAQAAAAGAVVVFPQGIGRSFNAGGCCGQAAGSIIDDLTAAHSIIDDISAQVAIDPNRIYATGFSNGGHLADRLGCESDRFAAVAPVAASRLVACGSPAPTSLLAINGLADRTVPAAGQRRPDGSVLPPAEQIAAEWRAGLNCGPVHDSGESNGVRRQEAQCPHGRAVGLITVAQLGHTWPRAADGLDATAVIWDFFAARRL